MRNNVKTHYNFDIILTISIFLTTFLYHCVAYGRSICYYFSGINNSNQDHVCGLLLHAAFIEFVAS